MGDPDDTVRHRLAESFGPRADWPAELATAVDLVLGSPSPMVVCWGPDLLLVYNDAFAPSAGDRHPAALGRPLAECFPDVAKGSAPLLHRVLRTGQPVSTEESRLVVRRGAGPEEAFWRFGVGPVHVGDRVAGVFGLVEEITDRVVRARRTALLARLAEPARDSSPDEAVAAVLAGSADVPWAVLDGPDGILTIGSPPEGAAARLGEEGLLPGALGVRLSGTGAALLGLNPLRPADDEQVAFLQLVAAHLVAPSAGVSAPPVLDGATTDFFTGVSHEFRTPLSLIMGPLEVLLGSGDPVVREEAGVAHRSAQRMLKLVNTLLDVSRLEAGRTDAVFAPIDLGALTGELAGLFSAPTERAGLRLDIDSPPSDRPVWADQDMWEKIVLNLLSNALKFTFEGGLRVRTHITDDRFVLEIADTGTGVPEAEVSRLFDRFHRVRAARARSREGSGIGLALVRNLAEVHGGTVEVSSVEGSGSVFTVRVPLGFAHLPVENITIGKPPAAPHPRPETFGPFVAEALRWTPAPAAEPTPLPPEVSDTLSGRVLVVDDDPDMLDHLRRLLSADWSVRAVASGEAALELARADPPDLVVADVMMPEPDGIALLRALRADTRTAGLPVVLLSARAGEEAAVEGLAAGADDYLVKPFSARELLARVANHLQLGRVRRDAELRFRAMANSTPALIWVDDAGGHRVFVNRGWLDFTGATPGSELGLDWRDRIHLDDRERYRSVVAAATRAGAPFEVEYRLRGGDGRHRWVLDRGAPVGSTGATGGRSGGYVGGCLDIDDRHVEQRRHQLYAALGETLDREVTRADRFAALARSLVDEGLADLVRVLSDEGRGLSVRAFAGASAEIAAELPTLPSLPIVHEISEDPILLDPTALAAALARLPPHERAAWDRTGANSAILVPLRARGGMLGLLGVARCGDSPVLDDTDRAVFGELARRAAVAVDNARLLEQEQAAATRLGLLHTATAEMSAAATPEEVARIASSHLVALLDAPTAGVWQARGRGLRLLSLHGWSGRVPAELDRISLEGPGLATSVFPPSPETPGPPGIRHRRPLWAESAEQLAGEHPAAESWLRRFGFRSAFWLPLVAGTRDLGMVAVGFTEPRVFTPSDREAALAVAELAAQALDRSFLLVAETEGRRLAERLGAVATALSRATDIESVADVILAHGRSAIGADGVVVLLADDEGALHVLAAEGWGPAGFGAVGSAHPLSQVVRSGEPIWEAAGLPEPYPVRTAVPLLVAGKAIGAVGLAFAEDPAFGADERGFVLTLASQCAQAVMRARLHQAEHEVAVTLQRSLLPSELPEIEGLTVATRYNPGTTGTEAGGDWYDVLDLPDGRTALVVGDVVGRGPGAAAVMGQLRSALAANLVNGAPPATALEQLDLFARRVAGARASTVACAIVDTTTGALRYSCAGHPPPMVAGDGVRLLDGGRGTPLGVVGRPPYTEADGRIDPGETILLCSDGLFERRTEVIDDGLDRLVETFGELAHHRPPDMVDALLERMLDAAGAPDDTVVVLARRVPGAFIRSMPADPEVLAPMRRAIAGWAAQCGLDPDGVTDLQLAVGEAVTNAVEHAYTGGPEPGPDAVALSLELQQDGSVAVRVADHGLWRPPPEDPGYRGRGLALIRELAVDVEVLPADDGTEVWFRMPAMPVEITPRRPGGAADASTTSTPGPTRLRRWADERAVRLHVEGDLDLVGVAAVRADLLAALERGGALILALTATSYVSSAGIALLAELAQRARSLETRLSVVAPVGSPARRILALAGLDSLVDAGE